MSAKAVCANACGSFLEYDTPKIVHIKSKKVGCIFRLLQLVIIGYIAGYVIAWKKGYQDVDLVESATSTKLKGVAWTNYSALNMSGPGGLQYRVWDVADYVVPPQENDAFFVMTNFIFTPNQTQGVCPEDPLIEASICHSDSDCVQGETVTNGNGVMTGRCVPAIHSKKTCEIHSWCPVEVDKPILPGVALLEGTQNFTILIKNNIVFNKFNERRRNILDHQNSTYLMNCRFDPNDSEAKYCPVFLLDTIVKLADIKNYSDISIFGGVIAINIHWDCNLDHDIEYCLPDYSFQRLDLEDAKIAKGTNFRYASFYSENGTMYRDLYKSYGIRFLVKVTGQAGRFSVIPLLLNVGSGIGLLAIAAVISDFILCYVIKNRKFYFLKKYLYVVDSDANDDPLLDSDEENHTD